MIRKQLTVDLGHSLEVEDTVLDVVLLGLFRQVKHVGTWEDVKQCTFKANGASTHEKRGSPCSLK